MTKPAVLITGSNGGIGIALSTAFSKAGYQVIGCDIAGAAEGPCDSYLELDLREFARTEGYRKQKGAEIDSLLAAGKLNCLVNNAAVQHLGGAGQLAPELWSETLDVNLGAPFLLAQHLLPALEKAGGSVINISSIHAKQTKPGFIAYATSKAGLDGMTRALAVDLGGRVRVNSIAPAATETPMLVAGFEQNPALRHQLENYHPVGRIARPSEIADLAVFLASDKAAFITGEVVNIDGGIGSRLHDPG